MRSIALEGAPLGIRCNAICPGFVKSGMTTFQEQLDHYAGHSGGTEADIEHAGRSYHPTRDLTYLHPQRIADAALWLVSDAVTGVALPVEAGHLLMPGIYNGPEPAISKLRPRKPSKGLSCHPGQAPELAPIAGHVL
jgi:hypothetical protein